jgi:hypothetical protein
MRQHASCQGAVPQLDPVPMDFRTMCCLTRTLFPPYPATNIGARYTVSNAVSMTSISFHPSLPVQSYDVKLALAFAAIIGQRHIQHLAVPYPYIKLAATCCPCHLVYMSIVPSSACTSPENGRIPAPRRQSTYFVVEDVVT